MNFVGFGGNYPVPGAVGGSISIPYDAPITLSDPNLSLLDSDCVETVDTSNEDPSTLGICSICQCPLVDEDDDNVDTSMLVMKLHCSHMFHRGCLENALQNNQHSCSVCRKPMKEPQGSCPSGTMTISMDGSTCPGFQFSSGAPVDAISIHYSIQSGTQKNYHYHPGQRFSGTHRIAYLPHCKEGHDLLVRLVYAWKHGLIFTVGTSLTSHAQNVTVWTSIHHKTSLGGGAHGFPDNGYLTNCHESLNALYVPDALSCRNDATDVLAVLPPCLVVGGVGGAGAPQMPPAAPLPAPAVPNPPPVFGAPSSEAVFRAYVNSKSRITYTAPDTPPPSGGTSPSGEMSFVIDTQSQCPGFHPSVDVIEIQYNHRREVQKQYHPNPGRNYRSSRRTAVLPNNAEGLELLIRLMYSFHCGLSFAVGTSQTTGQSNSVVWSVGVPHKSCLTGGPFGFPDPNYMANCHAALDRLNLPNANGCMAAMP